MAEDILKFFVKVYHEHGPIVRIRVLNDEYVVMSGPEANLFFAREGNDHFRSKEFWEGMDGEMGADHSLISLDGPEHAELRQISKRGYGRSVLEARIPDAVAITRKHLDAWPIGESRPALTAIQRIVTEQLGTIVAGTAPGDYMEDVMNFIRTLLLVYVTRQRPGFYALAPGYQRAKKRSFELGHKIVEKHRQNPPVDREPGLIDDAIAAANEGRLLTQKDLMPIALGPYIAGLDTAASTIAFMMYALLTNPEVAAGVKREADALFANGNPVPSDLRKVDVLHRASLETLRRYPIAPATQRTATKPFEFGGYRIEAGQKIFIGMTVAHFIDNLHPDPYRFDIDRYLPERNEHRIPGAFAPFSLGSHTCLGAGLAETQIMLTIATFFNQACFELDPLDYQLNIRSAPTPAPANDFRVRRVG
jgi:cytochrome P450